MQILQLFQNKGEKNQMQMVFLYIFPPCFKIWWECFFALFFYVFMCNRSFSLQHAKKAIINLNYRKSFAIHVQKSFIMNHSMKLSLHCSVASRSILSSVEKTFNLIKKNSFFLPSKCECDYIIMSVIEIFFSSQLCIPNVRTFPPDSGSPFLYVFPSICNCLPSWGKKVFEN